MKLLHVLLSCVSLLVAHSAVAQCTFDQFGTISNPDDPACRDAQYTYTENISSANQIALGYPPPVPVDSLTAVAGFRSYASLHARHQDLMMIEDTVHGEVVGQTRQGRDIWAYLLGDPDDLTTAGNREGAALINGGIHAREWQTPEVLTEVFEQLVETATDAGLGQYLRDNFNVVLIPVLNVDGFLQTQRFPTRVTADVVQPRDGRMRRKNMSNSAGTTVDEDIDTTNDNFDGVDLNRNSVHGFGLNNGSSNNTISLIYRGSSASSEPEIQALRAAALLGPADRLRLGIDVHSFTQVFFAPRTGNTRRDAITQTLASRMRAVTGFKYAYAPDPVASQGIGTIADFFAYEYQIPAWTLETEPANGGQDYGGTGASHSGFVLPDAEITRTRDELAAMLLAGFYRQSGPPHVAAVQIQNLETNEIVYAAQWIADGAGGRRLDVTSDRAVVDTPETDFRIWIAFNKPMRWYDEQGQLVNYPGQTNRAADIEIQSADAGGTFTSVYPVDDSMWLSDPGGAPNGYLRYRGDAIARDFRWLVAIGPATVASLQLDFGDIAQMALDADPATIADWQNGHWAGYEDAALTDSDSGGANCSFVIFLASDPDATSPPKNTECRAFREATTPPPPPPPPPPPAPAPSGGSGGGGAGFGLLLTVFLLRRRFD